MTRANSAMQIPPPSVGGGTTRANSAMQIPQPSVGGGMTPPNSALQIPEPSAGGGMTRPNSAIHPGEMEYLLNMGNNTNRTLGHFSPSRMFWPFSPKLRQVIVEQITRSLSSEVTFYTENDPLSQEEAATAAKEVERISFDLASKHFMDSFDGTGHGAVRVYSTENYKLSMEFIERRKRIKEVEEESQVETTFDISKGHRGYFSAARAKALFKPLAEEGNSYTGICLSNRSFSVNATRLVKPILASVKHQLTHVDLSNCFAGRTESEALEAMEILSSALEGSVLRILNLSSNALGEKGVRAFGSLLKSQSNLEELYLMDNNICPEAANAVCELLPSTDNLKILQFHNDVTGNEGAFAISDILKRSPLLEGFRCSSMGVADEGGFKLMEGLETCKNLKKIDLRDNMFGAEVGTALSNILAKFECLSEVYLSYLNLGDAGTIAICNALKEAAPSLKVLDIAGNEITTKSITALVCSIHHKHLLMKLNLSNNELKNEGAVIIGKVLEEGHPHLEELDVSTNSITRVGAGVLAKTVLNKLNFSLLNLNGNPISREGINEVKEILKSSKKSVDVLGPLGENHIEGGEKEEDDDEED